MKISDVAGFGDAAKALRREQRKAKRRERRQLLEWHADLRKEGRVREQRAREAGMKRAVDTALGLFVPEGAEADAGLLVRDRSHITVNERGKPVTFERVVIRCAQVEGLLAQFKPATTRKLANVVIPRDAIPKGWLDMRALTYTSQLLRERGASNFKVSIA
jgi:hypothetical protein